MRKKNGFTLVELIVTVGLTITILAVGITSYITIGNKQKKEAKEMVVKQIETAGQQYFESNKYLLENLNGSNYISLQNLVQEDYLNITIDPTTKKEFDGCYMVVATKIGKKPIKYTFREEKSGDADCKMGYEQKTSTEPKLDYPNISIDISGKKGLGDWYVNPDSPLPNGGYVNITITARSNNADIKKITWNKINQTLLDCDNNPTDKKCQKAVVVVSVEGKMIPYTAKAIDENGRSTEKEEQISIDVTPPICKTQTFDPQKSGDTLWINKTNYPSGRKVTQHCTDNLSGCIDESNNATISEERNNNSEIVISDWADNKSNCPVVANIDNTPPTCGTEKDIPTQWVNYGRYRDITCVEESGSLCKNNTFPQVFNDEGVTGEITIKDNALNETKCTVVTKIDKTPPVINTDTKVFDNAVVYHYKDYKTGDTLDGDTFYDSDGNPIYTKTTDSKSDKIYELQDIKCFNDKVRTCTASFIIPNVPGAFDVVDLNLNNTNFDISGEKSFTRISSTIYNKNGERTISGGCKKTDKDNPCNWFLTYNAIDNAGNSSTLIFNFTVDYLK
ncbi:MAG: type II secretion system protein [Bacilli bacterium]